jgi:hypothetical protein
VCSRKKILISDPRIKEMNKTRWLFEGWQVRLEAEAQAKLVVQVGTEAVKSMRSLLCSILGTNLEPIAEPDPEKPGESKYRWPTDGEFTPLIMAIARPDYIQQAMEKVGKIVPAFAQEGGEDVPAPLATEEDLEFFDDLNVDEKKAFWDSLEMQQQHKQYVIPLDPSTVDPTAKEQPRPPGLTDADREELMRSRSEQVPSKLKFSIDTEIEDLDLKEPK